MAAHRLRQEEGRHQQGWGRVPLATKAEAEESTTRKFIIMPVLIQGSKQPGNDIDVYLRPLVDELLQLWAKPGDRKSTRLNSSHITRSRMPSSA